MSIATLNKTNNKREISHAVEAATSVWAGRLETTGGNCIRYGLVLVLLWIGGMKFTAYEAENISGLVSNSPLMSWAFQILGTRTFSALIGVAELMIALLIAARPFFARLSAVGSVLAVGMFLTTLTFLFSTPGVFEPSHGFPVLSVLPGQFLLKDVVLLGAAIWTAGESLRAVRSGLPGNRKPSTINSAIVEPRRSQT